MNRALPAVTSLAIALAPLAAPAQEINFNGAVEMGVVGGETHDDRLRFHTDSDFKLTFSVETQFGLTFGGTVNLKKPFGAPKKGIAEGG